MTSACQDEEQHITGWARALGAGHVPIRTVLINGLYCGVSSANTAFKTAQQVFHEMDNTGMDTTP
jgi:hypothetical protein